MASWGTLPDLANDDVEEIGEQPLLYSERRNLPQLLQAETDTALQLVGANLNLGVAETGLRATTQENEVDRSLKDLLRRG